MRNNNIIRHHSLLLYSILLVGVGAISSICLFKGAHTKQYSTGIKAQATDNDAGAAGMEQYFFNARKNPITNQLDYLDMAKSEIALSKVKRLQASERTMANFNLSWKTMGPDNVGGRTRAILIDNQDLSGNTLFAGGVSGGLWKSTNGGVSWDSINDNLSSLEVNCIAQDPSGVIYIGTGEGFAVGGYSIGEGFSCGMLGGGLFKSKDGGKTFYLVKSTLPDSNSINGTPWSYINRLAISPCNPKVLYASIYGGLMASNDSGTTWHYAYNSLTHTSIKSTANNGGLDIKVSTDGSVIVACEAGTGYISYPDCSNPFDTVFTKINSAKVGGIPTGGRIEFAISPSNSNYIYASVVVPSLIPGKGFIGVYLSMNKGAYWYLIGPGGSPSFDPYYVGSADPDQGCYDNTLGVYPTQPGQVLVGGTTLWSWTQSSPTDTVGAWKSITTYSGYPGDPTYIHPDEHAIVFDINHPSIVYVGCDGGIYKSATSGASWEPMNRHYDVTQFYAIDASPYVNAVNGEGIIGGTQDNGTPYLDGTNPIYPTDEIQDETGGDGGDAKISFINPNIFFASIDYCQYLARGGGLTSHSYPGPFYTKTEGLNKGANIDSIATQGNVSGNPCFVQPLALYENLSDDSTIDSIMWTSDNNYSAGTTVYPVSPNGNVPFAYTLTAPISTGNSIMVKNIVVAKIATGFIANNYVWLCMQADDLADPAIWMPIGGPLSSPDKFTGNDPVHCMAWSPSGNDLFVGTEGGQLFRFSNLNAIRDSSYTTGAVVSVRKGAAGFVFNPLCVVSSKNVAGTLFSAFNRDILSISVDPYNGNNILVTLGNYMGTPSPAKYVYYSTNALSAAPTFTNVTGNLPPMPVYSSILHVLGMGDSASAIIGTEHGVYSTSALSAGTNWSADNSGAPNTLVLAMKQQTLPPWMCNNSGNVYIGTHGRGAWYTGTIGPLSVPSISSSQQQSSGLKVYPNPMNTEGTVEFTLTKEDNITLTIYTLEGKAVKTQSENLAVGEHQLGINTDNMSNGTYIVTISGTNFRKSTRIVVVR